MVWQPIADIARDVQAGKTTATDQVERALRAVEENSEFAAIISTTAARARQRAKELDSRVKNCERVGRLAGVPFIAKDNFLTFGSVTTAASRMLENFTAPYQATVIERLEDEGAICVAKANLDAFGHGSSTENSDFMVTKNPQDRTRVPGGSSGGSAAAVSLGMVPFALGTDTGGSSRQPASFSGCVGFKPTYGLFSRFGIIAMASSTDTVGVLAGSVADCAQVTEVLAGKDGFDSTTIDRDDHAYTKKRPALKKVKMGLIKEYFSEGLDSAVREAMATGVAKLTAAGATVQEISLPSAPLALAIYYVLVPAEISSNLSRYDGQRYGYSHRMAKDLNDSYEQSRAKGFGAEAKRRIMLGTYVLSSGYYDAYYKTAQRARTKLINEYEELFTNYDFLVGPTAPTVAFKIGQNTANPLSMYLADVMTVGASLAGIPAISLPLRVPEGSLPAGLQIMAPKQCDRQLLGLACEVEKVL